MAEDAFAAIDAEVQAMAEPASELEMQQRQVIQTLLEVIPAASDRHASMRLQKRNEASQRAGQRTLAELL